MKYFYRIISYRLSESRWKRPADYTPTLAAIQFYIRVISTAYRRLRGIIIYTEVYEIMSLYFNAVQEECYHRQVADKAFEEKARNGLFKFLNDKEIKYRELDRTVKKDGKAVAEWEYIVEGDSGQVVLLECRHFVTSVLYSINFL